MASKYSITALGELLIDFTEVGTSQNGQKMFERNPGGAPANVLVAARNHRVHRQGGRRYARHLPA